MFDFLKFWKKKSGPTIPTTVWDHYWTEDLIGTVPVLPMLLIYLSENCEELAWYEPEDIMDFWKLMAHPMFNDYEGNPSYYVDNNLNLFFLQMHPEGFPYPKYLKPVEREELIAFIKRCRYKRFEDLYFLKTTREIFEAVKNKDMSYENRNYDFTIRGAFWEAIGSVEIDESFSESNLFNTDETSKEEKSIFRHAFLKVDTSEGTIIASDGLSGPFWDFGNSSHYKNPNGIPCELYLETLLHIDNFEYFQYSWHFNLLFDTCQWATKNPALIKSIQANQPIFIELENCAVPEVFQDPDKRTGVLLGLPSSLVPYELELYSEEMILLINVKILYISEVEYIKKNKNHQGLEWIATKILEQEHSSKTFIERQPVV